jgi:hypothetical protein
VHTGTRRSRTARWLALAVVVGTLSLPARADAAPGDVPVLQSAVTCAGRPSMRLEYVPDASGWNALYDGSELLTAFEVDAGVPVLLEFLEFGFGGRTGAITILGDLDRVLARVPYTIPCERWGPPDLATDDPRACAPPTNPASRPSPASARGYWIVWRNGQGGLLPSPGGGGAPAGPGFILDNQALPEHAIAVESTASGEGLWRVGRSGGVYALGDARLYGDMHEVALNQPIVGMAATPTGDGYWLLAADGGVFAFGDAPFHGSTGGMRLNAPVIAMAATPTGDGYWLIAADGGVFTFGDARFFGSTGGMRLAAPVTAMAVRPQGDGYWLFAADGGVFTFGGARFHGSVPGEGLCRLPTVVDMRSTDTGAGYWLVTTNGRIHAYGDAWDWGGYGGFRSAPTIGIAVRHHVPPA